MEKIAFITARSGSKGLADKNILMLHDKPVLAYTIEAAVKSKIFQRVIVSTDSLEYKMISERYGAEVILRSEELASDNATTYMVIEDLIYKCGEMDYFVLLQPTSPFRDETHIMEAVDVFERNFENSDFLVSVEEAEKSSDIVKKIGKDQKLCYFDLDYAGYRRQNRKEYSPNGAIFIGKPDCYLQEKHFFGRRSIAYFMDKESSVDIDDIFDFKFAVLLMNEKKAEKILEEQMDNEILLKQGLFNTPGEVLLIGHSIFDNWKENSIGNKKVINAGIGGITARGYYEKIIEKGLLKSVPDNIIIMLGINDIKSNVAESEFYFYLDKIVDYFWLKNKKSRISVCGIIHGNHRYDIKNDLIDKYNQSLEKKYADNYIDMGRFDDEFGVLCLEYTKDGLHLNQAGYKVLKDILESC